jgi:hypothetical protein
MCHLENPTGDCLNLRLKTTDYTGETITDSSSHRISIIEIFCFISLGVEM